MKPWMKERDLLLQQTLAFVQGVVAAKPTRIASTGPVALSAPPAAGSQAFGSQAFGSQAAGSQAAGSVVAAMHDEILGRPASPPVLRDRVLPQQLLPAVSERADILKRVAAFRAHQDRLLQERETYYATVQAKIRTVLGNEMTAGRLGTPGNDKTL